MKRTAAAFLLLAAASAAPAFGQREAFRRNPPPAADRGAIPAASRQADLRLATTLSEVHDLLRAGVVGHHVALVGLAKLLASKGYDKDEIQKEIDVWKNIFYPNGVDSGAGACG